jgi:hypothetical protein
VLPALCVQARLSGPACEAVARLAAGGARVMVRTNSGQGHFSIITPGDPACTANEATMRAVPKGESVPR